MPAADLLLSMPAKRDLTAFASRAQRIDAGAIRLLATGTVLTAWTAVISPAGLLDATPTVLAVRGFRLAGAVEADAVVATDGLLEALERAIGDEEAALGLPDSRSGVAWAGITPPRGGWAPTTTLDPIALTAVVDRGVADVSAGIGDGLGTVGDSAVAKLRGDVWGRPEHSLDDLPAAVAFAIVSMGFDDKRPVQVSAADGWQRATTSRGDVLVKPGRRR